ncbi:methylmalonyl-CoA mutase small subunit [Saccharicrinis sp. FJH62]|uniref:methylmalonyl-CoA mutase small subunit n=1 Tax=Saccharicrinis sp. FJH62 TaxID=3344657 RepID=UPI0035D3FE83
MADNKMKLFSDFPPVSTQEWMDKIVADLKGADFDKKLVWRSKENVVARPFYRNEDLDNLKHLDVLPGEFPFVRGVKAQNNSWYIRQDISVKDVKEANAKALEILMKGVDSLGFCFDSKTPVTEENLSGLLRDIDLESAEVNFSCPDGFTELAKLFAAYVKSKGFNAEKVSGSINFDPYGRLLCTGKLFGKDGDIETEYVKTLIEATAALPNFRVITVNAKHLSNAGAYITQELGYGLSMGNEYLAKLTDAGLGADIVASNIRFNFGVGSNYFMEMAKFRAARYLWAVIAKQFGAAEENCKMIAHAETSKWNMTIYDAHVNMLRTQTEAMSASIAGVHSMTVLPFDKPFKKSDKFSERVARNQQLLLKEESHFEKIVDASAGSYYIENLTDSIAQEAWKLFLDTEDKGGYLTAVKAGFIQEAIKEAANSRRQFLAQRRDVLLGTNQYPNFNEAAKEKIEVEGATGCCCANKNNERLVEPLKFGRGSEEFEALRLATEAAAKRPKVFMLKLGNLAMRQARGQFSGNFFACAGYEIIDNLGYKSAEAGVKAALDTKADIVVICSSDDEYAEFAPQAYEGLKGKAIFVVAGAPSCMDELKAKGIENFIHVRSNVLEELKSYNKLLFKD